MAEPGELATPSEIFNPVPFTIREEQSAGILPKPLHYSGIPEMTPEEVLPQTGFDQTSPRQSLPYFLDAIKEGLKNPDWLFIEESSEEYNRRVAAGLPVPRNFSGKHKDIDRLKKLVATGDLDNLAKKVNSAVDVLPGVIEKVDIVVRALEVMSLKYPNLALYRGGSFREDIDGKLVVGIDFAPGGLDSALSLFDSSAYTGPRGNPVIAAIKFKDLVTQYGSGNLRIETEHNWWRGSIAVYPKRGLVADLVHVRKPPASPEARQAVVDTYRQKAIKTQGNDYL